MATRVVSTKLNEEEHRRIMEICNNRGITVSKLLKKTLLERIREEKQKTYSTNNLENNSQKLFQLKHSEEHSQNKEQSFQRNEERFMYY